MMWMLFLVFLVFCFWQELLECILPKTKNQKNKKKHPHHQMITRSPLRHQRCCQRRPISRWSLCMQTLGQPHGGSLEGHQQGRKVHECILAQKDRSPCKSPTSLWTRQCHPTWR